MKAAPEDQRLLLDVQRLDNEAAQVAHRITEVQKGAELADLAQRAVALRSELSVATGSLEDAQRELARVESDVATVNARVQRDTTLLAAAKNAKDAAGLESEMASLNRRIGDLETGQLELMERIELLQARVGDAEAALADVEVERSRLGQSRDERIAVLTEERASVESNRATIASRVPAELLALYERQRTRYGFGASLLQGGVSSASGVALTGSDLARVRAAASDEVLLCPDSEAILVRTDESGLDPFYRGDAAR